MARRNRIRFPGATYHVMSRGNRKSFMFVDDVDRRRFLKILAMALERYGAICYAYCLMGNHVHLVIHTPRAQHLSSDAIPLTVEYAKYCNWRHNWTGHLYEGRFKGLVIDDTIYLGNAIAYVARNPIEAQLVTDAADWKWSSYRASMGRCACPKYLCLDWLPRLFTASTVAESRRLFSVVVHKAPDPDYDFGRAIVVGSKEFQRKVRKVIGATLYRAALPRQFRAVGQPPLGELFDGVTKANRRAAIMRAHVVHGYLLSEIARYLDLHPTTISRIVNRSGSYRQRHN